MVPTRNVADIESDLKRFYSLQENDLDRFQNQIYSWVSGEVVQFARDRAHGGKKSKVR
jgi:hypothetical protein